MVEGDAGKAYFEWFGAALLALLTLGTQAYRYINESTKKEPEPDKRVVLETAELADMTPFRTAVQKLDRVLEMEADVEEMMATTKRIEEILERMDRQGEIERQAQRRAEELVRDRERERERGRDR